MGKNKETGIKELGEKLRFFRKCCDLSQEDLAYRLGVSREHISDIETGKISPSVQLMIGLCNELDVSADELLVDLLKVKNEKSLIYRIKNVEAKLEVIDKRQQKMEDMASRLICYATSNKNE